MQEIIIDHKLVFYAGEIEQIFVKLLGKEAVLYVATLFTCNR